MCEATATCANTPGSYECNCNDGYARNGSLCVGEFSACLFL